ncbi:MAG TPA: hypothetical protein VN924_23470 [Bryobacteraceae bacterium]|nr:hypothetical protein [Bryobacteraceae bacterium]
MNRTFSSWWLAGLLALAGTQAISAQTAAIHSRLANGNALAPAQGKPDTTASTNPTLPIVSIGSSLTWASTNAPGTFTTNTTFSSTPVLVDNGAAEIWQVQTPTGTTGEWDVFYLKTTNGGPLAGNIDAYWSITIAFTLNWPVYNDGVVDQWLVNDAPVSPLTNGIGSICCASLTNPILTGPTYYNMGNGALPAGTQTNWQQIYVQPYSLVSNGGVDPSTANEFIFALHFTLQAALPAVQAAVSASSFGEFPTFAPGSWIEIYGTNLAAATQTWASSDFNGVNGPTTLGGTTVTIGGQSAFIDYVSPLQVNAQVPGGVSTGSQPLVVATAAGSSAPFAVTVDTTMPGLLAPSNFNIGGTQYVVAQFADGSYVLPPGAVSGLTSKAAQPGDEIVIYGIGFGSVAPDIPPGQLVQQSNTLAYAFTISFGGTPAVTIPYEGLAPNFMGLYQFNVVVPTVPAGNATPLTFTLGGVAGTQTLAIAIGN